MFVWQQMGAEDLVLLLKPVLPKSMDGGAGLGWVPRRCLFCGSQAGYRFRTCCLKTVVDCPVMKEERVCRG